MHTILAIHAHKLSTPIYAEVIMEQLTVVNTI